MPFRDEAKQTTAFNRIVTVPLAADSVDSWVFVADQPYRVNQIREIHSVVGGTSAAVQARIVNADSNAPGASAGSNVINQQSATFNLTATVNVLRTATLVTEASCLMKTGDRIGLDFSGTLTGLVGLLQIELTPIPS